MKAEELIIGGWVNCLDASHESMCPARVIAIEEGQETILVERENVNWFVDIGWIQPIRITPGILEMSGFKKSVTYGTEKWIKDQVRVNSCNDTAHEWLMRAETAHNFDAHVVVRYVHELQAAMRLCGFDYEINL